ncbi:MAG: DEAD/DEAH box helicase family protein [Clostridiales bacterium]|nr:DEAD/DEAH box helicase family protein [Clostridiales bacterium]
MTLQDFIVQNSTKMNEIEQIFVEDIFYQYAGENGLDYLQAQTPFEDSDCRTRKLDFTVSTNRYKYVIEIDGYTYHAEGAARVTPEYFDDLIMKQNDLILNGYILIRFSYNQIRNHPDLCINTLRRSFKSDAQINPYHLHHDSFSPTYPQQRGLDACEFYRNAGTNKGVVILPTGMGKTILAALDAKRLNCKTLFVVHKNDILTEAYDKFCAVWPESTKGFFNATEKDTTSQVIFASKDTLYRDGNIEQFHPNSFDYIIIDEVHHSSCTTYKKITDYFKPRYMLGLTATPERQDRADILELFNYNIYYELPQREAIESGYLSGFKYYGLKDDIDYSKIKYNGNHYDVADLGRKLNIPERNEAIFNKYEEYASGKKAIGFCVNIQHAIDMAKYFSDKGIAAAAVHSDTSLLSTEQKKAYIQDFRDNALQILFTVDLFNEGVDFPDVEALLFLRPTESKTIFIQQLGRGLRLSPNKSHVIVLDFIGNFKKANNIKQYIKGATSGNSSASGHGSFGVKDFLDWPIGCDVHFDESVEELFKANEETTREISNDELIDNYYEAKEKLHKKPRPEDMNDESFSKFKLSTYRNHFETWNKFLESIGEATKASYHYPQGTHLGHIFYIVKTLGDKKYTDLVNPDLYISEKGLSKLARQTRYKIWACMEIGFLFDDRNPDEEAVDDTFKNLTPAGKTLYDILCKYVTDPNFYGFSECGKTEISWQMVHKESFFNDFIKKLPDEEYNKLANILMNMDAVKHMLIYLFHENKNITHFNKGNIYKNFFSSPYIQEYFDMNGISVPTEEGSKHRLPFILNILEALKIISYSGRSDFDIIKLPLAADLFKTDNFSSDQNIIAVKQYYRTGTLPNKEQVTELRIIFGADFLTSSYKISL